MAGTPVDRVIGQHDADIVNMKNEIVGLRQDVAEIKELLNRTRGGWQALTIVAGIAGAIGAFITKLFTISTVPHP